MTKLNMCVIPQPHDQNISKIQALVTYTPFPKYKIDQSNLCGSQLDLCGSLSSKYIYCCSSSFDEFLVPFLDNFATTIQNSPRLDSSWSGRNIRQQRCQLSKTHQCDNFSKNKSPIIRYNWPYNGNVQYQANKRPFKMKSRALPQKTEYQSRKGIMLIRLDSICFQQCGQHQTPRYSRLKLLSSTNDHCNQGCQYVLTSGVHIRYPLDHLVTFNLL